MTGDEEHVELIKKAYAWHEHVRQKELELKQLEAWKLMAESWMNAGRFMQTVASGFNARKISAISSWSRA